MIAFTLPRTSHIAHRTCPIIRARLRAIQTSSHKIAGWLLLHCFIWWAGNVVDESPGPQRQLYKNCPFAKWCSWTPNVGNRFGFWCSFFQSSIAPTWHSWAVLYAAITSCRVMTNNKFVIIIWLTNSSVSTTKLLLEHRLISSCRTHVISSPPPELSPQNCADVLGELIDPRHHQKVVQNSTRKTKTVGTIPLGANKNDAHCNSKQCHWWTPNRPIRKQNWHHTTHTLILYKHVLINLSVCLGRT